MIAMGPFTVSLDEYFAFILFCWMCWNIQIVTNGIFAVVNNLAPDVMQDTVVEVEPLFGQAVFQSLKRVVVQIVGNTQCVRGVAILDLAVWQTR